MFDALTTDSAEQSRFPEGLDELSPGPELARMLASIEVSELGVMTGYWYCGLINASPPTTRLGSTRT
jgi:hypothetical protein